MLKIIYYSLWKYRLKPQWNITSHPLVLKKKKKKDRKRVTDTGQDLRKVEPLYTIGGNVKWYSHYGKQSGGSSKKI